MPFAYVAKVLRAGVLECVVYLGDLREYTNFSQLQSYGKNMILSHITKRSLQLLKQEINSQIIQTEVDNPGRLYYIKILAQGKVYYKLGFTRERVEQRMYNLHRVGGYANSGKLRNIDLILIDKLELSNGCEANVVEQQLHKLCREYCLLHKPQLYSSWSKLLYSGNSEVYDFDILGLDFAPAGYKHSRTYVKYLIERNLLDRNIT